MTAAHTARGKATERAVATWLRRNGFPGTERTVRTGYSVDGRTVADAADLDLCPGVVVQCKALRPVSRAERGVPGWMAETEAQREQAGAAVALLVVRRDGTSDVGEWWAFLPLALLTHLVWDRDNVTDADPYVPSATARLTVADAALTLRLAGYGTPVGDAGDVAVAGES